MKASDQPPHGGPIARILVLVLMAAFMTILDVATALTVTSTNDSGSGSLRQTIQEAAPADTIEFSVTGLITLTNGELLVTRDLVIVGPGATNLALSGHSTTRVFEVASGISLTISGLAIVAGRDTNGGGIYNAGSLTLLHCAFLTNVAAGKSADPGSVAGDGCGGAVYNSGALNIWDTVFHKNAASGGGFGLPFGQGSAGASGFGGGVYNSGSLSISSSTFFENVAIGGSGVAGANATQLSGPFPGGVGGLGYGGAIYNGAGNVNLTNNTFVINSATGGNGGMGGNGLWGYCHTFPGNRATPGADGGSGGSGLGGGLYNFNGFIRIVSATFSSNTAVAGLGGTGGPGGTCFDGPGSARSGSAGALGFALGGALHSSGVSPSASIRNTIVADNSAAHGGPDVYGPLTSGGYNLLGKTNDSTGWLESDLKGSSSLPVDPKLGPLQNNGGATFTMAVLPGSPALQAGDDTLLTEPNPLGSDQRGLPRKSGAHIDIGAFELQLCLLTELIRSGANIVIRFSTEPGQKYQLQRTDVPSSGVWTTVAAEIPGTGGTVQAIDFGSVVEQRFYRCVMLP